MAEMMAERWHFCAGDFPVSRHEGMGGTSARIDMFEPDTSPRRLSRVAIPTSEIDHALTAQLLVGWAGESGEEKRLGWWRSDLVSPFGGMDLFRRLLPSTWEWAVLQGAREAARRKD